MVEVRKLEVFYVSAVLVRPSAGIGVVEAQKLEVLYAFCGARPSAGIGVVEVQKQKVFFLPQEFARRDRRVAGSIPPGPRAGFASCTKQLA